MPPQSLDTSPVEIIETILDHFSRQITSTFSPWSYDRPSYSADLARLALTCRRLHTLAMPHLYRFPDLYSTDPAFLLARTLIARPDLGRLVRFLHIDTDRSSTIDVPQEVKERYEAQFNLIDHDRQKYPPVSWDELYPNDLLISLCPNAESFESSDVFFCPFGGKAPFLSPTALRCSNLKTLRLSHWDTEGGLSLMRFEPLLFVAADSISSLSVHMLLGYRTDLPPRGDGNSSNTTGDGPEERRRLEKVTRIDLTCSTITAKSLSLLLLLCPNVEEFQYEAGGANISYERQFCAEEAAAVIIDILDGEGRRKPLKSLKKFSLDLGDADNVTFETEDDVDAAVRALDKKGIEFVCTLP